MLTAKREAREIQGPALATLLLLLLLPVAKKITKQLAGARNSRITRKSSQQDHMRALKPIRELQATTYTKSKNSRDEVLTEHKIWTKIDQAAAALKSAIVQMKGVTRRRNTDLKKGSREGEEREEREGGRGREGARAREGDGVRANGRA